MSIPTDSAQATKSPLRNSGPLSTRKTSGKPRSLRSCSKTWISLRPVSEVAISTARHSRLKSSMTLNVRNRLSVCRASLIKSADHTVHPRDDIGIMVGCILWGLVKGCPRQADAPATPLNGKAMPGIRK